MRTGMKALAALAAAMTSHGAAAQTLPPVEAFGRLPFVSQVQLSPDGKHFAGIQSLNGKPAAVIYAVDSNADPQVFASDNWTVASVHWVKNDRVVMFTKTSKPIPFGEDPNLYTWYRAISLEVGGTDWTQLFGRNNDSVIANSSTAVIVDKDIADSDSIYMPLWTRPHSDRSDNDPSAQHEGGYRDYRMSLYRVDVRTGIARVVNDGSLYPGYWVTDGQGTVVGRVDQTRTPLVDHLYLYNNGSWNKVRDFDARADAGANVFGLTFDGKSLAVAEVNADGRDVLGTLDRTTGASMAPLFSDSTYDIAGAMTDDWTGRVIGAAVMRDRMAYSFFEPTHQAVQDAVAHLFPDEDAHPISMTLDRSKAVVAVEAPDQPRTYYLYDVAGHTTQKLASEYPDLKPRDLSQVTAYPYKARDGLDIPAYLTMPVGRPTKNLPVVVMPHGGPDGRDGVRFDWWAQFLANRGYAVFQPNFRGSKGYGKAFNDAGHKQWGLKMQDDITDGVKKLIADGIADPKRICIVGASYGGYAALAGATFTPDLYACAVSVSGPSDLARMLVAERAAYGEHSQTVSFWHSRIGDESADAAQLNATSPALHADQVHIPVLLMHGKLDTTVPIAQSEEERDALRKAGKAVEFVTFEGDDHYLNLAEDRILMLRTLETFLKAHIGH